MAQDLTNAPRTAGFAFAALTVLAFAASLLIPVLNPGQDALMMVPLALVVAVWAIPLIAALLRGEPWAFVLALALLIFFTEASFRARSWADKTIDAQVMVKAVVWLVLGGVGMIRLSRSGGLLGRPPAMWALLFIALLFVSALWSPIPLYTLQSATVYLLMFVFGVAAAEVLDERQLLFALALGTGMIVLPSLAISPFAQGFAPPSPGSTGTADRLRGLADHPIPLADIASVFTFAIITLWLRAKGFALRWSLALLALAGAATVLLTQSRLPPAAMLASALALAAYRRGGALLLVPTLTLCVALVALMESVGGFANMLPDDILALMSRSGSSHEVLTVSGRMEIWQQVVERIWQAPLFGHGHASGLVLFKSFVHWKITHAHNFYLQVLLYTGLLGFCILGMALMSQLRLMAARPSPVRDTLVLYTLLKGVTEQSILSNMPAATVTIWAVTVGMAAVAWRARKRPAPTPKPVEQPI